MSATTGAASGTVDNSANNKSVEVRLCTRSNLDNYTVLATVAAGATGTWSCSFSNMVNQVILTQAVG